MKIKINDAFYPLLTTEQRYLVLKGGAGAGKSVLAAQKIFLRILSEEPHRFLIARKVARTLRESVFQLFRNLIVESDLYDEFQINKSDLTITHEGGNQLIFVGADDPEKLKSIADITGIWLEEATEFEEEDFDQIDIRLRGETTNYKQIILSFNPVVETHWIKKRFFDTTSEKIKTHHSSYVDNAFIDEDYKNVLEMKAAVSPNFYRVYKLGEWGKPEVQRPYMYNFEREVHIEPTKLNIKLPILLSFDFNVDPFVCVAAQQWWDKTGHHFHFIDEFVIKSGDIVTMCDKIKSHYPQEAMHHYEITGDATGRKRDVTQLANLHAWAQIAKEFGISLNSTRLKVPRSNPSVRDNRFLCNAIWAQHPDVVVGDKMNVTVNELEYTEVSPEGDIIKKNRQKEEQRSDALDCVRYMFNTFIPDFISNHTKYTKY